MTRTHVMGIMSCAWLLLCLNGTLCRADACTDAITFTNLPCVYKNCSSHVYVGQPSGGNSFLYDCQPVQCCQQFFSDCEFSGGDCQEIELRNPEVRQRLTEMAATSTVLVADCRGHYALYEPRPGRGSLRDSVLLNEHILR